LEELGCCLSTVALLKVGHHVVEAESKIQSIAVGRQRLISSINMISIMTITIAAKVIRLPGVENSAEGLCELFLFHIVNSFLVEW
jgi:hypothetical protein